MTRQIIAALSAMSVVLASSALIAQRVDLDLTIANRPPAPPEPEGPVTTSLRGPGSDRPPSPLRARLLRVTPSCEVGDRIVFDVELENASRETIVIPWTIDPANEGTADSARSFPVMTLFLRLAQPGGPEAVDGGEILYGNPADSFTVRSLAPRETVVIRGGAVCETLAQFAERKGRRGRMAFRVAASVTLQKDSTTLVHVSMSNSQPVTMVYPEEP